MTIPGMISAIAALIAGVCWFYSASIKVPDNQDTFISALQRAGAWNRAAAFADGVANVSNATVNALSCSVPVRKACADIVEKVGK